LAWWHRTVTLAFGRLRKENLEFQVSLGYIERTCLKNTEKQNVCVLGGGGGGCQEGAAYHLFYSFSAKDIPGCAVPLKWRYRGEGKIQNLRAHDVYKLLQLLQKPLLEFINGRGEEKLAFSECPSMEEPFTSEEAETL
jgi:hypothetical protein